jgi:hypothetical protein
MVFGGSFNPAHTGHVEAVQNARAMLQDAGYDVAHTVVAPTADKLLKAKLDLTVPREEGGLSSSKIRAALAAGQPVEGMTPEAEGYLRQLMRSQVQQGERIAGQDGAPTNLPTASGNQYPARYRVVDLADLKTSHNPETFAKNPDYPEGIQERAYHSSKEAQARVIRQAQNFNPSFLLNTTPTAIDGPPIITPDGTVLGGNSRAMTLGRLANRGQFAEAFQKPLVEQAQQFGLNPDQIRGMKNPVLVREIEAPQNADELRRIASDLNKPFTGALGVSERAVSAGRSLRPESLQQISDMKNELGEDTSLRELLSKRPKPVLDILQRDGLITDRERPGMVDSSTGGLSEEGKNFVERALLGSVIDDPDLMDRTPKNVLNKLGGSLGELASLNSRNDKYNISPLLRAAAREHVAAAQQAGPFEDYMNQRQMFGERSKAVEALAHLLNGPVKNVRSALRSFVQDARADVQGQSTLSALMQEKPSPVNAFNHAFGTKLSEREFNDALRAASESEARPAEKARKQAIGPAGLPRSITNQ